MILEETKQTIEKNMNKNGDKSTESHSNSPSILDNNEIIAVQKSVKALQISKLLLFVTVNNK